MPCNQVMTTNTLRQIPSITQLLAHERTASLLAQYGRSRVLDTLRTTVGQVRDEISAGLSPPSTECLLERSAAILARSAHRGLVRTINASGVLLHTGLGRAPLPTEVLEAIVDASGYCLLEIDPETGRRGDRQAMISKQLCSLSGAEAAMAVNNNAAAVMLAIAALATGREVVVSRGELIEIGGAFRLPDIISASGGLLVEVGTTNQTRRADYETAITDRTAIILKCHPSNYRMQGYTSATSLDELAQVASRAGTLLIYDAGSGALDPSDAPQLDKDTVLAEAINAGCDLVLCSGDKLLGGPQAGLIMGRAALIDRLRIHPLARAIRPDKLTIAAVIATLNLHTDPDMRRTTIPALAAIHRDIREIRRSALRVIGAIKKVLPEGWMAAVVRDETAIGGGASPDGSLPTWCVRLEGPSETDAVTGLARDLRASNPAIVGRIRDHALILDMRAVFRAEEGLLTEQLHRALIDRQ